MNKKHVAQDSDTRLVRLPVRNPRIVRLALLHFVLRSQEPAGHAQGVRGAQHPQSAGHIAAEQDGREAFRSNGSGKLSDVLAAAFGSETFKQLLPVESTTNGVQVSGYTSSPETGRGSRERMHIFINGRAVQDHLCRGGCGGDSGDGPLQTR